MDAVEGPRRFSVTSPLLTARDAPKQQRRYGTLADPSELEGILSDSDTEHQQSQENEYTTTAGSEAKQIGRASCRERVF